MLESNLSSCLVQSSIGLNKDLARLLLSQDGIADLGTPKVHVHSAHFVVQLGPVLKVTGGLVDVNLLQIVSDSCGALHG